MLRIPWEHRRVPRAGRSPKHADVQAAAVWMATFNRIAEALDARMFMRRALRENPAAALAKKRQLARNRSATFAVCAPRGR